MEALHVATAASCFGRAAPGQALRWIRTQRGRNQVEVARSAGITKAMLSAYETGKQAPSVATRTATAMMMRSWNRSSLAKIEGLLSAVATEIVARLPTTRSNEALMGWLDDIARKRVDEKRSAEESASRLSRQGRHEVAQVDRMVKRALKEIGRAYWGSIRQSWRVEMLDATSASPSWSVRSGSHYWNVRLAGLIEHGRVFEVEGRDLIVHTRDKSEAELRRCLRLVVESGPRYESD